MKLKPSYLALIFTLLFGGNLAQGQDSLGPQPKKARTPEDYKLRTLNEIAALGLTLVRGAEPGRNPDGTGEAHMLVHGDLLPSRVKVTYKGQTRSITRNRKAVISQWAQRYAGNPEHYTVPYTAEVLFGEAGLDHWLVVKATSLPEFKRELRRGRPVDVYLIRLGAFKTGRSWRWVLLVEDFARPK